MIAPLSVTVGLMLLSVALWDAFSTVVLPPHGRRCLATCTPLLRRRLASVAVHWLPVQQSTHAPELSHHLRTALSLPPARSVGSHDSGRLRLAPFRAQNPPECAREPERARLAPLPERDNLLYL